jgi:hypothetical protein
VRAAGAVRAVGPSRHSSAISGVNTARCASQRRCRDSASGSVARCASSSVARALWRPTGVAVVKRPKSSACPDGNGRVRSGQPRVCPCTRRRGVLCDRSARPARRSCGGSAARRRDADRRRLALLCLRDRRHRHTQPLDAVRQVAPQPLRDPPGQRRDDHLIERALAQRGLHRLERVLLTDDALDRGAGRALEQRQRRVERPVRAALARLVRDQQREAAGPCAARSCTVSSSSGVLAVRLATTRILRVAASISPPTESCRSLQTFWYPLTAPLAPRVQAAPRMGRRVSAGSRTRSAPAVGATRRLKRASGARPRTCHEPPRGTSPSIQPQRRLRAHTADPRGARARAGAGRGSARAPLSNHRSTIVRTQRPGVVDASLVWERLHPARKPLSMCRSFASFVLLSPAKGSPARGRLSVASRDEGQPAGWGLDGSVCLTFARHRALPVLGSNRGSKTSMVVPPRQPPSWAARWHATESRYLMDAQLHRYVSGLSADAATRRGWAARLRLKTQLALFDEPCIAVARRLEREANAIETDARSVS